MQGDVCLAEIAECIKKVYANYGYCYRIGGDEFCVLLKNSEKEGMCKQEFLWRMEEKRKKITFLPTVSYGSASFSGEDIVEVKERADWDMYQYKSERNAAVWSKRINRHMNNWLSESIKGRTI